LEIRAIQAKARVTPPVITPFNYEDLAEVLSDMKLTEKAMRLLDGKNFGSFAFVTPKGNPHVSPVWVDRSGDIILINAADFRAKVRLLKENQKVMLSITNQENPYERVLIRGRVVEITKKGALEQNNRMSMKYIGTLDDPDRPNADRVLIKIEPERITS
jgi:PPOX class probable F420-dependent enzyme